MDAILLAAGAGTRLRPLTDRLPKPLLPLGDGTVLSRLVEHARHAGASGVHCNAHHLADVMHAYQARELGPAVRVRTEPHLRGPAGSLHTFAPEIQAAGSALVLSGDLYLGGSPAGLVAAHRASGAALTIALVRVPDGSRFGVFEFADDATVSRVEEKPLWAKGVASWVSAGVYCVDASILDLVPSDRPYDFAADLVPAMLARGLTVHVHPWLGAWDDLGTPAAYHRAVLHDLHTGQVPADLVETGADGGKHFVHKEADVHPDAELLGDVYVAAGARVGAGARVRDSVLLPGADVPSGAFVAGALAGGLPR